MFVDRRSVRTAFKETATPDWQFTSERRVFNLLDHLHHTADGNDCLPAWFLRLSAPVYTALLAHLMNLSFSTEHVPSQWKTAIIHPIPKVEGPSKPADYRPISVVPVRAVRRPRRRYHCCCVVIFWEFSMTSSLSSLPSGRSRRPMVSCFSMLSFFFKFAVFLAHHAVQ